MPTNEELQKEIDSLRSELDTLKSFVRGMYVMMSSEDEYVPSKDHRGGAEVGRMNS